MIQAGLYRVSFGLLLLSIACPSMAQSKDMSADLNSSYVIGPNFQGSDKSSLTAAEILTVKSAQKSLIEFFRATQVADKPLSKFLAPHLIAKFATRRQLMDELLGQEVTIDRLSFTGFDIRGTNEISLRYYIVIYAEGSHLLREDEARLRKEVTGWKIAAVGGLK
jgi:hypothetical protein